LRWAPRPTPSPAAFGSAVPLAFFPARFSAGSPLRCFDLRSGVWDSVCAGPCCSHWPAPVARGVAPHPAAAAARRGLAARGLADRSLWQSRTCRPQPAVVEKPAQPRSPGGAFSCWCPDGRTLWPARFQAALRRQFVKRRLWPVRRPRAAACVDERSPHQRVVVGAPVGGSRPIGAFLL